MIRLVPEWAYHYTEFWDTIRRRNLWFIKLRYFFVILLVLFYTVGQFILQFKLTATQEYAFISVAISILLYNLVIHDFKNHIKSIPGQFNHMHLSLLQMILDLTALMILVYFTGTAESPLYMFFIFQMVVGSLILPGYIVYIIGIIIISVFGTLVFLQHYQVITTYTIQGLYNAPIEHTITYLIIFVIMFSAMMLLSILLANTIAIKLYQREKQLWETLEKLSDTEKAKQKYIIGVVHEIKTPIAAVQSLLDLVINMFMGPVSDAVMEKLKRARIRTIESITLINNVLHLSKIKLLDITNQEELDITEIFEILIEKQSDSALSKNIKLTLNDIRETRRKIKGDLVLFELAFSNVLGNAIKYNLTNGKIDVNLMEVGDKLIIEVHDNGIGIPEIDKKRIFDQFFRASNIKGQQIDGSGLGLSLVNEVITRYKGSIEVYSPSPIGTAERPGTSFKITLPYSEAVKEKRKKKKKAIRIHDGI